MQAGRIESHLPKDLVTKASGAVVDRKMRYIGLIVNLEERPFHTPDLPSFDEAIDLLAKAGVPIQEDRNLRWAFWLAAAAGMFLLWLAL